MAAKRVARRRETALTRLAGRGRPTGIAGPGGRTRLTGQTGPTVPSGGGGPGGRTRLTGLVRVTGLSGRAGPAGLLGAIGVLCGLLGLAGLAGCSSGPPQPGATGTSCGTSRTGANVPVQIQVVKGTVSCADALHVERDYATMIRDGDIRGNGGGAPATVDGWTCEGYPTPQVLRTGDASECHTASAEVVAVLAPPSPTALTAPGGPAGTTGPAGTAGPAGS